MPEVFSFYTCAPSHNRQNLDETVADLARRTAGSESRDWMTNDRGQEVFRTTSAREPQLPPEASPDKLTRPVRATRLRASSKTRGSQFLAA